MPIRIQLWKSDAQIGKDAMTESPDVSGISESAYRVVDYLITSVHAGNHGNGTFRIECDHTNERGVFLGSYYRADLTFPRAVEQRPVSQLRTKPL